MIKSILYVTIITNNKAYKNYKCNDNENYGITYSSHIEILLFYLLKFL